MISGILLGLILGIPMGFIPGLNTGLLALYGGFITPDIEFNYGLIIGINMTSNVLKILNILQGYSTHNVEEEELTNAEKIELVWCSIDNYVTGKFLGAGIAIFMVMYLGDGAFSLSDPLSKGMCMAFAAFFTVTLITDKATDKGLAIINIALVAITSLLITNLPIEKPMFLFLNCLFIVPNLRKLGQVPSPITIKSTRKVKETIQNWQGLVPGILCSILWGTSSVSALKAMEESDDNKQNIYAKAAICNGCASSLTMAILLQGGGPIKSESAYELSKLSIHFDILTMSALILMSALMSALAYLHWEQISRLYIVTFNKLVTISGQSYLNSWQSYLNIGYIFLRLPIFIPLFATIGQHFGQNVSYDTYFWYILIFFNSVIIQKLHRFSRNPSELSISGLSIVPVVNMIMKG